MVWAFLLLLSTFPLNCNGKGLVRREASELGVEITSNGMAHQVAKEDPGTQACKQPSDCAKKCSTFTSKDLCFKLKQKGAFLCQSSICALTKSAQKELTRLSHSKNVMKQHSKDLLLLFGIDAHDLAHAADEDADDDPNSLVEKRREDVVRPQNPTCDTVSDCADKCDQFLNGKKCAKLKKHGGFSCKKKVCVLKDSAAKSLVDEEDEQSADGSDSSDDSSDDSLMDASTAKGKDPDEGDSSDDSLMDTSTAKGRDPDEGDSSDDSLTDASIANMVSKANNGQSL